LVHDLKRLDNEGNEMIDPDIIAMVSQYGIGVVFALILLKFVVRDIPKKIDQIREEQNVEFKRHYEIICKLIEAKNDHIELEMKNHAEVENLIGYVRQSLAYLEGKLNKK